MRRLLVGNKLYSSWSLRPWILMRTLGIPFEETLVALHRPESAARIAEWSPAGRVPVLVDDDVTVWDTLAITEHLAETTAAPVWPKGREARALARSIVAEMHAGFSRLREALPMNLGKSFAYRERPEAAADIARVQELVLDARRRFGDGGPFLFGAFTAADAFYAPVMSRFWTYSVPLEPEVAAYRDAVLALPAFGEWREAALDEPWVLDFDEVEDEPLEVHRRVPVVV
ncbi:MAG: glutathione S-transferase family protein [Euryarchaeota archaeon]|nr:glutathione S-transferase family protein [Euryarchaeota archaeon]